jgi:hypothetical protein
MSIPYSSLYDLKQTIFLLSDDNTEIAVIQMELFAPPVGSLVALLHNAKQQSFTVQAVQTVLSPEAKSIRVYIRLAPLILVDKN